MRLALSLALLGLLAGCTQPPTAPATRPAPSDACRASQYARLMGKDRALLDRMTLPDGARVIGPEMAVTADYRPDRLNVEYDENDMIVRVSCF